MQLFFLTLFAIVAQTIAFVPMMGRRFSSLANLKASTDLTALTADAKSSLLGDSCSYTRTEMNEYVLQVDLYIYFHKISRTFTIVSIILLFILCLLV